MKLENLFLALFSILLTAQNVAADKGGVPHHLKPGQIISADVLNEIFESLAFTDKIPTRDDFLGTWMCIRVFTNEYWSTIYTSTIEQGILYATTGTITFATDGSGNYFANEPNTPSVLYPLLGGNSMTMTDQKLYATKNGFLYLNYSTDSSYQGSPFSMTWPYKVKFRNTNQFNLEHDYSMQPGTGGPIICDRIDIPPNIPELTSATVDGTSVILSWTDTSDDETGFVVLRRDSLEGDWLQVGPVISASIGTGSTMTYTNTSLTSDSYWYRVQSVNTYGTSLGSNILQADVQ